MLTVNCPACGTAYDIRLTGLDSLTVDRIDAPWPVPAVDVETADDGSGWFLTCPPNQHHADPERFPITREDVA